jgi:hypothetical protein
LEDILEMRLEFKEQLKISGIELSAKVCNDIWYTGIRLTSWFSGGWGIVGCVHTIMTNELKK